jgi:hypothetical protein
MTSQEIFVNRISSFIEKNLPGNTPFASTSDFILYIANKESKKKTDNKI